MNSSEVTGGSPPARRQRACARIVTLAGVVTLFATSEAMPQACWRNSAMPAAWYMVEIGRRSTPGTLGGAEMGRRFDNGLGIFAGVEIARFGPGDSDLRTLRIGGTYLLLPRASLPLATCLVASIEHESLGDLRIWSIPAGVAFSREVALSTGGWYLVPQLEPRIAFRHHAAVRDFPRERPAFTLRGGALFRHADLLGGPIADWAASGHPRWIVRARFGVAF